MFFFQWWFLSPNQQYDDYSIMKVFFLSITAIDDQRTHNQRIVWIFMHQGYDDANNTTLNRKKITNNKIAGFFMISMGKICWKIKHIETKKNENFLILGEKKFFFKNHVHVQCD